MITAWIGFHLFIFTMLALDLGVFNRGSHALSMREALTWSAVWIALAGVFAVGIYYFMGAVPAYEFLSGYLIEKSLSVDNLFVFTVIFSTFCISPAMQHRLLAWGIIGAIVLRGSLIVAGTALVGTYHWVLYIFGAILLCSGIKLITGIGGDGDSNNRLITLIQRFGLNPFLTCLLIVECSDLIFALDSIPATLAVTQNLFIVYTSNIFAVLGLRSLYFVLCNMLERFEYLKYGVSLVLVFIGAKILLMDMVEIPTGLALMITAGILLASVVGSLLATREVIPDVDI